jgi:hypothetical protein
LKNKLQTILSALIWAVVLLAAYAMTATAQTGATGNSATAIKKSPVTLASSTTPVTGGGTAGQISKWSGFNGTSFTIDDSIITQDKFGKIGIGTTSPTSKLTVVGIIETTLGGVKYPDGTLQTTAFDPNQVVRSLNGLRGDLALAAGANITVTPSGGNTLTIAAPNVLTSVFHNATLAGNGTAASPLGIANGGVGTNQLADNAVVAAKIADSAVTAAKIAPGNVIKSLNGLSDNVTFAAGSGITLTPAGNTLTIAATASDPEKNAFQASIELDTAGQSGNTTGIIAVPAGKRFVIEYVSFERFSVEEFDLVAITTTVAGVTVDYFLTPPRGNESTADKVVRIYADGNVKVQVSQGSTFTGKGRFSLSGHLVDLP